MMRRLVFAATMLAAGLFPAAANAHAAGDFAPVPDGGLSWETLTMTQSVAWVDQDGVNRLAPDFADEVEKLDGALVTVAGYRMPDAEAEARFTLYGSAVDCSFHVSPGPNMRMEVDADAPPPAAPGLLTLRGRLELVRARKGGVFYRLRDATVITAGA